MKNLPFLFCVTFLSGSAVAQTSIEKIEQNLSKKIGDFEFLNRAVIPSKTNRVTFQYKVPSRANVELTITELNPNSDSVDIEKNIDTSMQKAMKDYEKSEPSRIFSKLPDFADSLVGQGCGPRFKQLRFESKGRITTAIHNNFWVIFERRFIRISLIQMGGGDNPQPEIQFLNHVRAVLGDCK